MNKELQLVNAVLSALNERTVSALEGTGNTDVEFIRTTANQELEAFCSMGWWFNRVTTTLKPLVSGEIVLPGDVLLVNSSTYTGKAGKLYDIANNTTKFTQDVEVSLITKVTWDDLVPTAYSYLTALITASVLNDYDGDVTALNVYHKRVSETYREFRQQELRYSGSNILRNTSVQATRDKLGG